MMDNLRKCDIIIVDCCCMYKKCEETMDHIPLHCEVAKELRDMALCCLGCSGSSLGGWWIFHLLERKAW